MKVKIVNRSPYPLPAYATALSAGMDLRANLAEPLVLGTLERSLRTPAQEDDLSDKAWLKTFIADMVETMHHADGCGLAAPQVGVSKRILVVDGDDLADRYPELKGFHREMINPSFTFESEKTCSYEEGCLSIPNVDADITRPETIRVRYLNLDFEEVEEEFTGFAARMIQHEMDHLDGILFTDHASPILQVSAIWR